MPEGPGKPEKIRIDHIIGGDDLSEAEEGLIEIVPAEGPSSGASLHRRPGAAALGEEGGDSGERDLLEEARQEIESLKDQYVRVRADFENYRKRVERDRAEERARLSAGVVTEILPAIDNLDRALDQPADDPGFRAGVALIRRQIDDTLKKLGLEPIETLGEPFDPIYHEAVTVEPREGFAANTIVEEIRKGYTLGGRVVRPSLVKVAIPPPTASADSPGGTGETDGEDHRD